MRPERLYLADILDAADSIDRFLIGVDREAFRHDDLRQSAVLASHTNVPWPQAAGLRNMAVHEYFSVDWKIIWTTAAEDIPRLREQIADLVAQSDTGDAETA